MYYYEEETKQQVIFIELVTLLLQSFPNKKVNDHTHTTTDISQHFGQSSGVRESLKDHNRHAYNVL